ncbi:MAG: RidA family protein [Saprospiraceae bacterium]|nr:RidA family protein [Saprospiraceae bacterium]
MRQNIFSGAPWEDSVGYCRAVRIENRVEVSGTTSIMHGEVFMPYDHYNQTKRIYEIIFDALQKAGALPEHIVRVRIFVVDIGYWEDVARAHSEMIGNCRPAMSMIGAAGLIDPALVVEIEVTAIMS